ncbi:MAG TPA: TonB-dependent receptor [Bryobacteraceae bacterium]|nr:TonB-dependent receptor [Bryobacteraceae bacterium]
MLNGSQVCGWVALLILGVLPTVPLIGQILYGSLVGNVRDASGASVPDAQVTIRNTSTGQSRSATTDANGAYSFPTLTAGTYDLSVTKEGFRVQREEGINVSINTVSRSDLSLQVGAITESVTVGATAALLQTDRAEVRAEVTSRELQNVPVPAGRNYQNLFVTIPGFSPPRNAHSVPANPSRALQFNVNGTSSSSNNTRIDGASSTNVWLPHVVAYVPALESIEAVNVVTNSFDAEQGLAGGAAINVQIKTGSNDLHGSAFEYHNSNATKAKPFFLPAGQQMPKLVYNQFGGTLGGPIVRNKLFYFASYEGSRDRQFASARASVPTIAMRNGDFSGAPSDRPIFDPATGTSEGFDRQPFPNNIIPTSRLSPAALRIARLFPDPMFPGTANNLFVGGGYAFDRDTLDTKVNWNATDKFSMYGRFSFLDYRVTNPGYFGEALVGPPVAGGQVGAAKGNSYSTTIAGTYVVGPTLIVDAYFGYTRMQGDSRQPSLEENIGRDVLGLPGTNGSRFFEGGFPQFEVSGFTNFGQPNNFMPYINRDPQTQYVANANWNKGSHQIRFGTDLYRQELNQTQPEFVGAPWGASGGFGFAAGQTSFRARPGQTAPNTSEYNSFASFMLGLPNNLGRLLMVPDQFTTRTNLYSAFIRDQWQVNSQFTLSFGVRWEYFPFPTRADRGLEQYDFATNMMLVCGVGVVPKNCGVEESKKRFAPRLGLAYRFGSDMVVRAGYGLTNDPFNLARPFRTNHPLLIPFNQTAPNTFTPAGLLDEGIPTIATPDLGNGVIPIGPFIEANTVIPNQWKRGYIQSWNLAIQKRFMGSWVAEAAYVATRAVNQLGNLNRNAGMVGGGNASRPLARTFGRFANTIQVTGLGTYTYDSLQTKLERRFSSGFQAMFAYTFSKNMGIAGNVNSDGSPRIHLPEYFHLNRAVTDLNQPHNFQFSGFYELPFGRGKGRFTSGPANWLLGGWQVNGLLSAYSGPPYSVTAPGTDLNAPGNAQRADLVKSEVKKIGGAGPGQKWHDPTAFAQVREARFGTAGWNILQSPGVVNLDLGLFRRFNVTERFNVQFRAEAFNATNTPHFSAPIADVANTRFMEITSVRGTGREGIDERVFRFGLRLGW